jgi:PAS domain-containing protein
MDWVQEPILLRNIVGWITGIITISGVLYSVYKWLIPLVKKIINICETIENIASEFKTNGGTSLKDALNRLEANVEELKLDTKKIEARQWAHTATLKEPTFESDQHGLCVRANKAYLNLVEKSFEEVEGNNWENIIIQKDRSDVWKKWREAVDRQRIFDGEYTIQTQSGTSYIVHCVAIPFFESVTGKLLGYVGRFVEVKEQTA